ncbi:voltage-gated potassium channel [Streptomyces sp. 840.1]|uniref:potassium channel family protein n=1 Tax=Streptomyces sp. 840.1 TaxID=2485152 RepID=UPI000F48F737|nr:potassium channel family protein [Streptomyces sp. 840.1]ROQ63286.1 voltage-gated potassium channel [Streptomyces sp. 840.1]
MVPVFLTKAVELLLGREGRSLHLKAVGGATVVLALTVLAGSWAVLVAEQHAGRATITSYPRALWWSAETATTVGYGDFYPVTLWGRIVAVVVMGVGITTYGMVTAALATWFVGHERERRHRLAASAEQTARHVREETAQLLHERFDRIERLLADAGHRPPE